MRTFMSKLASAFGHMDLRVVKSESKSEQARMRFSLILKSARPTRNRILEPSRKNESKNRSVACRVWLVSIKRERAQQPAS